MAQAGDGTIYLTADGQRGLEQRLAAYEARFRQRSADAGGAEAEDRGDAATDLEAADDRLRLGIQITELRRTLGRALPLPTRPDNGTVMLTARASGIRLAVARAFVASGVKEQVCEIDMSMSE